MDNEHFEIIISSDYRFEGLIAEIWYKDHMLAQIDQETGSLRLEIYPSKNKKPYRFEYNTFLTIIEKAKKRLIEGD